MSIWVMDKLRCDELTQDASGRTPQAFGLCSCRPFIAIFIAAAGAIVRGTAMLYAAGSSQGLKVRAHGSQGRAKSIRWGLGALKPERCPSRRG
jgi:hypothetical protein